MNVLNEKIISGINMFSKMTALRRDAHEVKYVQDELDLIEALEFVRQKFHETEHLIGKPMYKGQKAFDVVEDIRRDVEEFYLTGREPRDCAIARKKYGSMICLVIDPVLHFMNQFEHRTAIKRIDGVINEIISFIKNNDVVAHYDDAVVIKQIVRNLVQEREENKKMNKKRKKNNKEDFEKIDDFENTEPVI